MPIPTSSDTPLFVKQMVYLCSAESQKAAAGFSDVQLGETLYGLLKNHFTT